MTTKVQKWGNSMAVRLPKLVVERTGILPGTVVTIDSSDKLISIKPLAKQKVKLENMLRLIKKDNLHRKVEWGRTVGKEVW